MAKKGEQAWFDKDSTPPEKNKVFNKVNMELMLLPHIDIMDAEQVQERLVKYLQIYEEANVKPTVAGLAMSLGISRQELWAIYTGVFHNMRGRAQKVPPEVINSIKRVYDYLENYWEMRFENGQINPVAGIFLAKNQFGYRDVIEQQVQQETKTVTLSADDIRARYLPTSDSPAQNLIDSGSTSLPTLGHEVNSDSLTTLESGSYDSE